MRKITISIFTATISAALLVATAPPGFAGLLCLLGHRQCERRTGS